MPLTWLHPSVQYRFRYFQARARKSASPGLFHPSLESLEDRLLLAIFTVTNTQDAGPGSLRQAILDANANPGLDTIAFDIGGGGVQTIQPASALPAVTDPVGIDGTTQPGFSDSPLIVLTGTNAGSGVSGLTIAAGNSTVKGLVINSYKGNGIVSQSNGGNVLAGNYIGTDATGTAKAPNSYDGVSILSGSNNTIGGTTPAARNVISANGGDGITIFQASSYNLVEGNFIGTDATGTRGFGNSTGVAIVGSNNTVGGTVTGAGNLISGNSFEGVAIDDATGNVVAGNLIGTDLAGTANVGHQGAGVRVNGAANNLIGGTVAGAGNVISGNSDGIYLYNSGGIVVAGNLIGTDITGTRAVGNGLHQVDIYNSTNILIGGTTPAARNVIAGKGTVGIFIDNGADNWIQGNYIGTDASGSHPLSNFAEGIYLTSGNNNAIGGTAAAGNVISANKTGIFLSSSRNNQIQGNQIGTDASGTVALGNQVGLQLDMAADGNLIGGTATGAGNVISGNSMTGLLFLNARDNVVQGNSIGTDISGTMSISNADGISITSSGSNNTIGGTVAEARNLISGNSDRGIIIGGSGNVVQGNAIGIDTTGGRALPNPTGVLIIGPNNTIGGTAAGAGNLISGNVFAGIGIDSAPDNVVAGNRIGTDASGTQIVANKDGVEIAGAGSTNNEIGGTAAGAGNVISGNSSDGILISNAGNNRIQGNAIGTDASGALPLGNQYGIIVGMAAANLIGGIATGEGNVISGNRRDGIDIDNAADNVVAGNRIGTDAGGGRVVGNEDDGVAISGPGSTGNLIGGTASGARNVNDGNGAFYGAGIHIAGAAGNVIQGNYIGTDVSGTRALGNLLGVLLDGANDNLIGGADAGAGNVVSGNEIGIVAESALGRCTGNQILGNRIGTDASGTFAVGNESYGIYLAGGGVTGNLIGGTAAGARNIISGNGDAGIYFNMGASANLVQGNYIGTDVSGTQALGNGPLFGDGIDIGPGCNNNLIGGTAPGAGNVISANHDGGVGIVGAGTILEGNYIGTDRTGTVALANYLGISVQAAADSTTIGGRVAGAGNLISGNQHDGILLLANGASILGNQIGTDVTGTLALGNGGNGVTITSGAHDNTIGGTASGAGNTIAFNGHDGVLVDQGASNAIRRNVIAGHDTGLGIELTNNGNNSQAAPVLTAATSDSSGTTIEGTLTSTPDTTFTVEFFADTVCNPSGYGEGERLLGSTTVTTDDNGNAGFTFFVVVAADPGQFIAATATDPNNNTSAFSQCVVVTEADWPSLGTLFGGHIETGFLTVQPTAFSPNPDRGHSSPDLPQTAPAASNPVLSDPFVRISRLPVGESDQVLDDFFCLSSGQSLLESKLVPRQRQNLG
jgi:parallel beta-helix repeat protein